MESIEQINNCLLEQIQDVNRYKEMVLLLESWEKKESLIGDLLPIKEVTDYVRQNKEEMTLKEEHIKREWKRICQSRTFNYKDLCYILGHILTIAEGKKYYAATRLLKHNFQIDESVRVFYKIVSFITDKRSELNYFLLENLTGNMQLFYVNNSPVIKPMDSELETVDDFDITLRYELQNRSCDRIYVSTSSHVFNADYLAEPMNKIDIADLPYDYINDVMEQIIIARYKQNGKVLKHNQIIEIISEYFTKEQSFQKTRKF